jgi:hypothetical protein
METVGLSKSWTDEVQQYAMSRLLLHRMLALLALLAAATWYVANESRAFTLLTALGDCSLLASLLGQFRLLDDLADVPVDRQEHPCRVLVQSEQLAKFRWLAVAWALLNISVVGYYRPLPASYGLLLINCLVVGWYRFSARRDWATVNYHVLLLKYPAFAFVIGFQWNLPLDWNTARVLIAVYLALCIYEVLHDVKLRQERTPRLVARCELAILVTLLALETWHAAFKTTPLES